jgi:indole-3-glycerol phosphate synthase
MARCVDLKQCYSWASAIIVVKEITMAATILEQIFDHKRTEVERQRLKVPLARIQELAAAAPPPRPFAAALRQPGRIALIAEVKKASPSKGVFVENFQPTEWAELYAKQGAAAISVLTDVRFFQGSLVYLRTIREHLGQRGLETPLLRKDFLYDPYQVYEARAYGADALLLIAAMLDDETMGSLHALTLELGMTPLVEVHTADEMARVQALGAPVVGINNRDLHTFTVDLRTTQRVGAALPPVGDPGRPVLVAESGVGSAADVATLRGWGVDAILVGESIVTAADPAAQIQALVG